MVKTNCYSGLNPVVVQALNNLQYRYSGETPEIWCSRIRYPEHFLKINQTTSLRMDLFKTLISYLLHCMRLLGIYP